MQRSTLLERRKNRTDVSQLPEVSQPAVLEEHKGITNSQQDSCSAYLDFRGSEACSLAHLLFLVLGAISLIVPRTLVIDNSFSVFFGCRRLCNSAVYGSLLARALLDKPVSNSLSSGASVSVSHVARRW